MAAGTAGLSSGCPGRRVGAIGPPPQDGDRDEEDDLMYDRRRDERDGGGRGRKRCRDPAGQEDYEHGQRRDPSLPDRMPCLGTEQA